ncbi:MAG: hypothetical protein RIC04_10055 [Parvibaculum sp.]|uniref:hypothetical protein n=1 Tax=Parvibaculum sp. TaxID=2024848 RepID=UPI0032EAF9A4
MNNIKNILIIGVFLLIAALLSGGRYEISSTGLGVAYVVDRHMGTVWFCTSNSCKRADEEIGRSENAAARFGDKEGDYRVISRPGDQ